MPTRLEYVTLYKDRLRGFRSLVRGHFSGGGHMEVFFKPTYGREAKYELELIVARTSSINAEPVLLPLPAYLVMQRLVASYENRENSWAERAKLRAFLAGLLAESQRFSREEASLKAHVLMKSTIKSLSDTGLCKVDAHPLQEMDVGGTPVVITEQGRLAARKAQAYLSYMSARTSTSGRS